MRFRTNFAAWSVAMMLWAAQAQTLHEWTNTYGIVFVWIPVGEFRMGSEDTFLGEDEEPVTKVRIAHWTLKCNARWGEAGLRMTGVGGSEAECDGQAGRGDRTGGKRPERGLAATH